jgi:Protein of unknown function (DUF3311)
VRTPPTRTSRGRRATQRGGRRWVYWLLVVPALLAMWPPLFNRLEPTLFGMPFFYWSQFALILLAMLVTAIVHVVTKPVR